MQTFAGYRFGYHAGIFSNMVAPQRTDLVRRTLPTKLTGRKTLWASSMQC